MNHQIIDSNSKQELDAIKLKIVQLDQCALDVDTTSYERRRLKDSIKNLHKVTDLKLNSVDVKKFSFRNEPVPNPSPQIVHKHHQQPRSEIAQRATPLVYPSGPIVKNAKHTVSSPNSHLLMTNISQSIVVTGSTPASINIQNGAHSIVQLNCTGPIFLHDLHDMVLILRCHQLRLHNVVNSTILVDVANDKLIIENCQHLKIGRHPLAIDRTIQVDDFNHPKATERNTNYTDIQNTADYSWIHNVADGALQPKAQLSLP